MGAGLGHQNLIPVLELLQRTGPADKLRQIPLMPGKQNGEGGQRHILRRIRRHLQKRLGIGNDQCGFCSEALQSLL
ncbi:hypothetical protein D3C75_1263780 [compost metagenome]